MEQGRFMDLARECASGLDRIFAMLEDSWPELLDQHPDCLREYSWVTGKLEQFQEQDQDVIAFRVAALIQKISFMLGQRTTELVH